MKEDVLEQVVDDYLMHKGYFTRHNLRFKLAVAHADYEGRQDSVSSDIDVIAIDPRRDDRERVLVLSCKAWQAGFDPVSKIAEIEGNKIVSGREAWRGFRELHSPKWAEAFVNEIEKTTGQRIFTYVTVVTALRNEKGRAAWENHAGFRERLEGNPIRLLTLAEMLDYLWAELTKTPASSDIGRAIQLMKAARWSPPHPMS